MRINRFYTKLILNSQKTFSLEESVSHHLIKVLRYKPGMTFILFNGLGGEYLAELISCDKKSAQVKILEFKNISRESPLNIHLAIAISKGDKMDWVMQKSTELGVQEITPIYSEFSDVKLKGERLEKKIRHWQQVVVSACEQSERTVVPTVNLAIDFKEFSANNKSELSLILHPGESAFNFPSENPKSICVLIGPEGGFSDQEFSLALAAGFKAVTYGPRILRTETAPVVALSLLQNLYGDF